MTGDITYTTYWAERANPDNHGCGRDVHSSLVAQVVTEEHNRYYPRFRHWAERVREVEVGSEQV